MKKLLLMLIVVCTFTMRAAADEGMWLLPFLEKMNIKDMKSKGLKLSAKDIYNANGNSLKDAIVVFGNGCTGEIVSKDGLIFTNHHCGYGNIQSLSSVEHDYLKYGFWAKNRGEELPAEGLSIKFIRHIEDVTSTILNGVNDNTSAADRASITAKNIQQLKEEQQAKNPDIAIQINDFFGGNQYFLFKIEEFKDVRLVGTPPSSIGKFGSETDNWMWPRHTGDFSIFRVYANKDNKPAAYSSENVPYKAPVHLKISTKGYKEGDFSMIMGFPGSTDRFMTTYEIDEMLQSTNPNRIYIRGTKQDIMKRYMDKDDAIRIKYASKFAQSSNYWKNAIGMSRGIEKLNVKGQKQEIQDRFTQWANTSADGEKYRPALNMIKEGVEGRQPWAYINQTIVETMLSGTELLVLSTLSRYMSEDLSNNKDVQKNFMEVAGEAYKDYDQNLDMDVAVALYEIYIKQVPDALPEDMTKMLAEEFDGDVKKFVYYVYGNSKFTNLTRLAGYVNEGDYSQVQNDPAVRLYNYVIGAYQESRRMVMENNKLFNEGHRLLIDGLMKMEPNKMHYPDANFTIRLTYGNIFPYKPLDGVKYDYYTTLTGVMEKEDPTNLVEFEVPEKLKELYNARDFGSYGQNGELTVNFISNNDITGGNSGSPVLNANGELIGLAFDGNWEAMSGDVAFEPNLQRCINVDVRYVLFVIDKYAGAGYLLDEMTLVK